MAISQIQPREIRGLGGPKEPAVSEDLTQRPRNFGGTRGPEEVSSWGRGAESVPLAALLGVRGRVHRPLMWATPALRLDLSGKQ
jgi:hypothetical protein